MTKREFIKGFGVFFLAALFLVYEMAVQVSPSVMTTQLMEEFNIGAGSLGWMASVYFYSYTIMQIPAGLLYDRFGPKQLLSSASFFCAFGVLFFVLTTSVYPAALGRFLMGIGSSFAFIGVLVVVSRWFEKSFFPFFVGITQFLACVGAIAGEVPLSIAVEAFGWRALMICLMVIGFTLGVVYLLFLKNHPKHEFSKGTCDEHSIMKHLLQVISKSQSWYCAIYAFCGWGPMIMFAALWGVPYLSTRFEISSYYAALATMMMWLGCGISSPFIGALSTKIRRRKPILYLGSLLGLLCFSAILYIDNLSLTVVYILLFLIGIAIASHTITFALVRDNNPPSIAGTSIGFNNMAVVIGGAILQPIGGYLINSSWSGALSKAGVPIYSIHDFEVALIIIPILYLIGLFVSLFLIKETYCKNTFKKSK